MQLYHLFAVESRKKWWKSACTSPDGANETSPGAEAGGPRQARFWLAGVVKPWENWEAVTKSPVGGGICGSLRSLGGRGVGPDL